MNLKTKLLLLVAILLFFCVVVGIVGHQSSRKIARKYGNIERINFPKTTALLQSLAHLRSGRIAALELTLQKQDVDETKMRQDALGKAIREYEQENKIYTDLPFGEGEEVLFKSVQEQVEIIKKDFAHIMELSIKSDRKEGPAMDALRDYVENKLSITMKTYRQELNKLLDWHKKDSEKNSLEAHESETSAFRWIMFGIVSAIFFGGIISYFVMKNIMDDQEKISKAMTNAMKSFNMIEKSPINTMMSTPDGILTYMNENSRITLKTLQHLIPEKVDNLIGKSIDIFHKNPVIPKRIIADPKNLPHKAIIAVGPEKLDLAVAAILDADGKYLGPMVTWAIVTERVELVQNLTKASEHLANAASNVLLISSNLSSAAEETSAQANNASVASEEVNAGVQTVANNMEEMVAAIKEITKTTNEAANMTSEAMRLAKDANSIINKLGDSSQDIGNVIKVISSIAQQTNLLALNATIEAARAGDAGKGFAVVANEVKELANQTARATYEITKKIETIQSDSKNAVNAIAEISHAIEKVNGYTGNIAASVEEQAATTNEVTRIVTESAEGVKQISENIGQVSEAAASTGQDAHNAQNAAKGVGEIADLLKSYVARLKV